MVSVFGALNSSILVGPRAYFALGRDGLFPPFLGHVNPYFRTPARAILLQAGWCCALVLGSDLIREPDTNDSPFDTLTNYVMFGAIIFETMVIGSIFTFRWRQPTLDRPYRCWGYPWTPLAYVLIMAGVLVVTLIDQPRKSAIGAGFIVVGALAYLISRLLVRLATRSASGPAP
jgi:APA family basic amino acid/polyamine antiporter